MNTHASMIEDLEIEDLEIEDLEEQPTQPKGNLLKYWIVGMAILALLGWFNFSINQRLTPAEAFAEEFVITTEACLIPLAE